VSCLLVMTLAAACSAACASSTAGVEGWELLGTRTVSSAVDFDVIVVEPPASFRDLKLIVRGSPLRLHGVTVEPAAAGRSEADTELRVGSVIPTGGEVNLFEGGELQRVERAVFRYEAASLFGAAPSVSLYGRR
jgi:hypothetical protein